MKPKMRFHLSMKKNSLLFLIQFINTMHSVLYITFIIIIYLFTIDKKLLHSFTQKIS